LGVPLSSAAVLEITGCGGGKAGEGALSLDDARSRIVERRFWASLGASCGTCSCTSARGGGTGRASAAIAAGRSSNGGDTAEASSSLTGGKSAPT